MSSVFHKTHTMQVVADGVHAQNDTFKKVMDALFGNKFFSAIIGFLADTYLSSVLIRPFITVYDIDEQKYRPPREGSTRYNTFNEFFVRKLRTPINTHEIDACTCVSPVDGKMSVINGVDDDTTLRVKKVSFNLARLLNSETFARAFTGGTVFVFKLKPKQYHRFHFPFDCVPDKARFITGKLKTVDIDNLCMFNMPLTENERKTIMLDSVVFGRVAFVCVGAMFVGRIHTTYTPGRAYKTCDEMGFFSMGASSVVMVFPPQSITPNEESTVCDYHTIAVGDVIGTACGM